MRLILFLLIATIIIGLFLYSKLLPYKERLTGNYKRIFDFFNNLFTPLLGGLKNLSKPATVGQGLAVDMSQVILLVILLLVLKLFA
jgi:hypothetical protein